MIPFALQSCLCSHSEALHDPDLTGRRRGPCSVRACGCESFRPASRKGKPFTVPRQYRAAAPGVLRVKPAGTCSGCGEVILLREDGLVRAHRLSAFGRGSAKCDGSYRAPAETERKIKHGTPAGYQAHRRYGIPLCDECREAYAAYFRAWRRRDRPGDAGEDAATREAG